MLIQPLAKPTGHKQRVGGMETVYPFCLFKKILCVCHRPDSAWAGIGAEAAANTFFAVGNVFI